MTIQFQPENSILRECSFYVIAEIGLPDDADPIRVSAAATNYLSLVDAVGRALFTTPADQRTEHEIFVLQNVATTLQSNDRWNLNSVTNAPMDAHVGFDDGDTQLIVRVFAVIDTLMGAISTETVMVAPITGADHLYMSLVSNAKDAGNISFIGQASPETFRTLLLHSMHDTEASVMRLKPPGIFEGFLPDMTVSTQSDTVRTIDLMYPDGGDLPIEEVSKVWQGAGGIVNATEGGVSIRVTAEVETIFQLIEQTKIGFVGYKIAKD